MTWLYRPNTHSSPATTSHCRTSLFETGTSGLFKMHRSKWFFFYYYFYFWNVLHCQSHHTNIVLCAWLVRPQRGVRSPGPGSQPAGRNSPGNAVTSMVSINSSLLGHFSFQSCCKIHPELNPRFSLWCCSPVQLSPSFTPTSVIRKMYATKEKSKDEPSGRSDKEEAAAHSHDGTEHWFLYFNIYFMYDKTKTFWSWAYVIAGNSSPNTCLEAGDGSAGHSGVKASSQTIPIKDQERLRPGSSGPHTPAMAPPGTSSSFPRPVYPVPLLSHVSMMRPPPPQLHPNVVQRMLAQGIQPQQLGPALVQAGECAAVWLYGWLQGWESLTDTVPSKNISNLP